MITCHLIVVGRLKSGPLKDAFDDYAKRLKWKLVLEELDIRESGPRQQDLENNAILNAIPSGSIPFVLDERGKTMPSAVFAETLQSHFDAGDTSLAFIIGGADGLMDSVRDRARHLISFGKMTWPHMLARVMLAEQLYRAQQILAGHPYHRA